MQLYLIRHGQSMNNFLWEQTGTSEHRSEDPELTETGRQQAALVAGFLTQVTQGDPVFAKARFDTQNRAGFGITHVYCGLQVRAVATGMAVAQALGLPLVGLMGAHETGGIFHRDPETGENTGLPGRTRAYFEEHYPDLVLPDEVDENGWWNRPFEEREERRGRAERFLATLLERHKETDDHVALVTHGGFYNYLLAAVMGLPETYDFWFLINNTGITRVDFELERTLIGYMNRLEHLPRELIT